MSKPIIRLGDKTTHGGTVVSAASATMVDGKLPARIGDMTVCPIPGHGANPIVSGDNSTIIDGSAVARQGDVTACGASLVASQGTSHSG